MPPRAIVPAALRERGAQRGRGPRARTSAWREPSLPRLGEGSTRESTESTRGTGACRPAARRSIPSAPSLPVRGRRRQGVARCPEGRTRCERPPSPPRYSCAYRRSRRKDPAYRGCPQKTKNRNAEGVTGFASFDETRLCCKQNDTPYLSPNSSPNFGAPVYVAKEDQKLILGEQKKTRTRDWDFKGRSFKKPVSGKSSRLNISERAIASLTASARRSCAVVATRAGGRPCSLIARQQPLGTTAGRESDNKQRPRAELLGPFPPVRAAATGYRGER